MSKENRDVINDSLEDWRDQNDNHRTNGAESDFYLKLPVPYRARNGNLQDTGEMLQIRGRHARAVGGIRREARPADFVTVYSARHSVNINTAPPIILKALRLSEAEISEVEQTREIAPYNRGGPLRQIGAALTRQPDLPHRVRGHRERRAARAARGGRVERRAGGGPPTDDAPAHPGRAGRADRGGGGAEAGDQVLASGGRWLGDAQAPLGLPTTAPAPARGWARG